ncbi:hypothetical protein, partial [Pseudomonas amygdali]
RQKKHLKGCFFYAIKWMRMMRKSYAPRRDLYSRQLARGDAQPSDLPDEKKALQPVDCRAFLKMVANQGNSGLFLNSLINQQLAILVSGVANEKVTHQVSHVRPQTASEGT